MKKTLLSIALSLCVITSYADMTWLENAPDRYIPANTQIIISSDSPCNKDGEAFKDFIPKFRTDASFRNSRLRFEEDDEMGKMMFGFLADSGVGYKVFKAVNKKEGCTRITGTWYDITSDQVCFRWDEDGSRCKGDWGGSSIMARFQRIDGKWYCTGFMMAG